MRLQRCETGGTCFAHLRERVVQAERVANGIDLLPHLQPSRGAQCDRLKLCQLFRRRVQLQHCHIFVGIPANELQAKSMVISKSITVSLVYAYITIERVTLFAMQQPHNRWLATPALRPVIETY